MSMCNSTQKANCSITSILTLQVPWLFSHCLESPSSQIQFDHSMIYIAVRKPLLAARFSTCI